MHKIHTIFGGEYTTDISIKPYNDMQNLCFVIFFDIFHSYRALRHFEKTAIPVTLIHIKSNRNGSGTV